MKNLELKEFLDKKAVRYNQRDFIAHDPISIPHRFNRKQDIEISGLFAALFAWGNRKTIINKSLDLLKRFDNAPYQFIKHHTDKDLKNIVGFKHRTFVDSDILFLVHFLKEHYEKYDSLEDAFLIEHFDSNKHEDTSKRIQQAQSDNTWRQESRLRNFYTYIFSFEHLKRTEKHISTPTKNSACKRINMFLRWMVRQDKNEVDFGLWKNINPSELVIPLDVHVLRVANQLKLLNTDKANWQTAVMLTEQLRQFDATDPVKYDFALFGMGVAEK